MNDLTRFFLIEKFVENKNFSWNKNTVSPYFWFNFFKKISGYYTTVHTIRIYIFLFWWFAQKSYSANWLAMWYHNKSWIEWTGHRDQNVRHSHVKRVDRLIENLYCKYSAQIVINCKYYRIFTWFNIKYLL